LIDESNKPIIDLLTDKLDEITKQYDEEISEKKVVSNDVNDELNDIYS
jgi:hypothetical protein